MTRSVCIAALMAPLALAACVVPPPSGPSVMALPKQGEDFAQFQGQDIACRNYAAAQIGYGTAAQAATDNAVGSAVLGTALGAAAGAAIGAAAGNPGAGAAIGGASGLLVGSAAGANNVQYSAAGMQRRYDVAYTQCMFASGYTVQQPAYGGPYYGSPGYPPPAYAYPAPYPYPYAYGPSVSFGFGTGWGGGRYRRW